MTTTVLPIVSEERGLNGIPARELVAVVPSGGIETLLKLLHSAAPSVTRNTFNRERVGVKCAP